MPEMMPYIWLGVIVLSIVLEALTMGLVAVWFLPGALVSLVLSLFHVGLLWQLAVFIVLAVVMLFLGKKIFRPFGKKVKTNTEALIGQTAVIIEQVCNVEGRGTAKIEGKVWSARAERDDAILETGDHVEIVDIRGVKLICRKQS